MKDIERDNFYLRSISEEIVKIENFVKGAIYKTFLKDEKLQYAVYKAFENIGEAAKNISKKTKEKHSDIPWRDLAGFRDKLAHGYFGIDVELVWKAVKKEVPDIKRNLINLVKK
ncbi:MAG: DUF86 domain-containing protein [bacterium]